MTCFDNGMAGCSLPSLMFFFFLGGGGGRMDCLLSWWIGVVGQVFVHLHHGF